MPVHIRSRIYQSEKRAQERLKAIQSQEKTFHIDFKTDPYITHYPKEKRWAVTQTFVFPDRPRRKRK